MYRGLLEKYHEFLPLTESTPSLSLGEGNTPLIPLSHLSKKYGVHLYGKLEGLNPTGSFKDRGMVVAIAKAKEEGATAVICASTGNTSASAAAYAARLDMKAYVIVPDKKIAIGKLAQAIIYGAQIISLDGNFDEALEAVRSIDTNGSIQLVNSINPYRIEGQKTAAFEICEDLQMAPDVLAIPVGNAGNITAYWKGFREWNEKYQTGLPRIHGFEAEGAAAIVKGEVISQPETIATAIRIGNPASWKTAVAAAEQSNGEIDYVTDEEILQGYQELAKEEGIFVEPASAAAFAGVVKHIQQGKIKQGETIVSIFTGNGLKDPNIALSTVDENMIKLQSIDEVHSFFATKD